jgi:hypothetical protein
LWITTYIRQHINHTLAYIENLFLKSTPLPFTNGLEWFGIPIASISAGQFHPHRINTQRPTSGKTRGNPHKTSSNCMLTPHPLLHKKADMLSHKNTPLHIKDFTMMQTANLSKDNFNNCSLYSRYMFYECEYNCIKRQEEEKFKQVTKKNTAQGAEQKKTTATNFTSQNSFDILAMPHTKFPPRKPSHPTPLHSQTTAPPTIQSPPANTKKSMTDKGNKSETPNTGTRPNKS